MIKVKSLSPKPTTKIYYQEYYEWFGEDGCTVCNLISPALTKCQSSNARHNTLHYSLYDSLW